MNTYSQGPIQNNIVPCQYHRATDFSHPIAQEPASEVHRIDNSIDPKVLMILKKLGKTGKSSDSRRNS
ncbi:hypothetical protein HZS_1283 [Henneguya salminicola]|nr:hypothetical protein HZS_1283 [Henneguya salminicola]